MTTREIQIVKSMLRTLHETEAQMDEISIHRSINDPQGDGLGASLAELHAVIAICDSMGWLTGVKNKVNGRMKWNINDAGEAALLEL
jgi:hypothetical protein